MSQEDVLPDESALLPALNEEATVGDPTPPEDDQKKRLRWPWIVGASALLAAIAVSAVLMFGGAADPSGATSPKDRATATITKGDLVEQTLVTGMLSYSGQQKQDGPSGTLTFSQPAGTVVDQDQTLFAVDNRPVTLLRGDLPQWRAFEWGMGDGPDVKQLETALKELGYFWGEPDEEFDGDTYDAIWDWQDDKGLERTGTIGLGDVVFASGPVRVASNDLAVGAQTGPGNTVMTTTSTQKVVNVELKLQQQQLAVIGAPVEVELPGGKKVTGKISAVEPPKPQEKNNDGGEAPTIVPVTITLDDPAEADGFDKASVRVFFTSETKENVLSVPVSALLALSGGNTGVEVVQKDGSTKQVPVETGLFAGGMVEVSGDGIAEGTTVVVPAS
ncbi:peptidoglycan-binding protein [Leucobacter sp. UT-8R-CII-1-4]|uniref:peptidoglycan-binding protein n=1 Tax=Leucobacter sp. UT-8R-CII-1-4 TaxID=3040075 RepID=UPI0024A97452|nr:peptidoglycan-binding protein [Leucobacter sp. UT-8R-CII-1-4]MDI6023370.1 peptidoglycan-binding protein [Leucobacter sp. UT-8R-CII-1-4]